MRGVPLVAEVVGHLRVHRRFHGLLDHSRQQPTLASQLQDLETAIGAYIDGWNDRAHPFTWTKNADEIISHAKPSPHRKKTYSTRH